MPQTVDSYKVNIYFLSQALGQGEGQELNFQTVPKKPDIVGAISALSL